MRIAIVGSTKTGKSSLLNKFETDLDFEKYDFFKEPLQIISRSGFDYSNQSTDCSQLAMLALYLLHLQKGYMVTENFILDQYLYAQHLKNNGAEISDFCLGIIKKYWDKYKNDIDLYIYCPIEYDITDESSKKREREMMSTFILTQLYLDIPQEKFLIVKGTVDERYNQIKNYIKALKEQRNVTINGKEF